MSPTAVSSPGIAIVDDDAGVRASLSSLLRAFGYATRTYASAEDFIAALPAGAPGCLISDVQMPGINGEQLQIMLCERGLRFPVIFLTAFPSEAMRARLLAAGASAFLSKPVDADVIADCLAALLPAG